MPGWIRVHEHLMTTKFSCLSGLDGTFCPLSGQFSRTPR
jgi:hypothetical protein